MTITNETAAYKRIQKLAHLRDQTHEKGLK